MPRRTLRLALVALAAAALTTGALAGPSSARPDPNAGPPYEITEEIVDPSFVVVPLKNAARMLRSEHGYIYESGLQDGHLVIRLVSGGLRLTDRTALEWRGLPRSCRKVRVRVGIAAVCAVPTTMSASQPLLVEVWPRLGDDFMTAASLPDSVSVSYLGDRGNDVARLGAGRDFFNGAFGDDRVSGGAGNDWIRAGLDTDVVWGGSGNDYIIAGDGPDTVYGDDGDDRVGGDAGDDILWGGAGADFFTCSTGWDVATGDGNDRYLDCEDRRAG